MNLILYSSTGTEPWNVSKLNKSKQRKETTLKKPNVIRGNQ